MTNYLAANAGPDPSDGELTVGLRILATACASSGCPTIYATDHGTLVVQGYAVSPGRAGLDLPDGELLVEIPVDLLAQVAHAI